MEAAQCRKQGGICRKVQWEKAAVAPQPQPAAPCSSLDSTLLKAPQLLNGGCTLLCKADAHWHGGHLVRTVGVLPLNYWGCPAFGPMSHWQLQCGDARIFYWVTQNNRYHLTYALHTHTYIYLYIYICIYTICMRICVCVYACMSLSLSLSIYIYSSRRLRSIPPILE